jgi:hypothetical protein
MGEGLIGVADTPAIDIPGATMSHKMQNHCRHRPQRRAWRRVLACNGKAGVARASVFTARWTTNEIAKSSLGFVRGQ